MFGPEVDAAIRDHAKRYAPCECCGIVAGGKYIAFDNKSTNPKEFFKLPPKAYTEYGEVQAIIHSHVYPRHERFPSAFDMRSQMKGISTLVDGQVVDKIVPWGIAWTDGKGARGPEWLGDHVLDTELVGRQFFPGIRDCYSAVRSYFWQKSEHEGVFRERVGLTSRLKLPEVPRDHEWWKNRHGRPAIDLIGQSFEACGFQPIDKREARFGDVLVMNLEDDKVCKVPMHCAVLMDKGLMYHHPGGDPRALSTIEPTARWEGSITGAYRLAA